MDSLWEIHTHTDTHTQYIYIEQKTFYRSFKLWWINYEQELEKNIVPKALVEDETPLCISWRSFTETVVSRFLIRWVFWTQALTQLCIFFLYFYCFSLCLHLPQCTDCIHSKLLFSAFPVYFLAEVIHFKQQPQQSFCTRSGGKVLLIEVTAQALPHFTEKLHHR